MSRFFDLLFDTAFSSTILVFIYLYLEKKQDNTKQKYLLIGIAYILYLSLFHSRIESPLFRLFMTGLSLFIVIQMLIENYRLSLYYTTLISFLYVFAEEVSIYLFYIVGFHYKATNSLQLFSRILGIFLLGVLLIITYNAFEPMTDVFLPNRFWGILILFPVLSVILLVIMASLISLNSQENLIQMLVILFIISFQVFSLMWTNNMIYTSYILKKKNLIMQNQIDAYIEQIKQNTNKSDWIAQSKHDIKKTSLTMVSLLKQNQTEVVIKELEKNLRLIENIESVSNTGNPTIDSIINYKNSISKELGITVNLVLEVHEPITVSPFDIGYILGNIWDNAIENVSMCDDSEHSKTVDIEVCTGRNLLIIRAHNLYQGELLIDNNGFPLSKKSHFKTTGEGMRILNQLVKKYHGFVKFDTSKQVFTVEVILYQST